MKNFFNKNWQLLLICLVSFVMFFPALTKFFTHDDFYFLKIANVDSFKGFLSFFNPIKDIEGIGVYRPLTLRVYYFLSVKLFHLSSLPLRLISFAAFFAVIILVWKFINLLIQNKKMALFATFLYAVSVTHFGQLYYIGAFQELFLTMLFLGSIIFFVKYEMGNGKKLKIKSLIASFICFILAIMSKETAVVIPFMIVLTHLYLKLSKRTKASSKTLFFSTIPYFVVLGIYLVFHFGYFGTISGDSYVWDFSISRSVNTLGWYSLWSINLPEMLNDFVGPGIRLNPNLLKYWSKEIISIFTVFTLQLVIVLVSVFNIVRKEGKANKDKWLVTAFSAIWFVATISPVLFLPVHKFTYYLTLPLVGVVFFLSHLLISQKSKVYVLFGIFWIVTSILSLRLTIKTNWITQGVNVSERVYKYFNINKSDFDSKEIVFVDTSNDSSLPWSPTATLKTVLSNKNFFEVFYPNIFKKVEYVGLGKIQKDDKTVVVNSRQFLGY